MILSGDLAVVLNLLSISVIGVVSCAVLLSAVWLFIGNRISQVSIKSRSKILWLWVTAPWLIGAGTLALFSASLGFAAPPWFCNLAHWHHPNEFNAASWHSLLLLSFALFSAWVVFGKARQLFITSKHLQALFGLTKADWLATEQGAVKVLKSDFLSVFTTGIKQPSCYLTSGLVKQLKPQELNIVVAHEQAHIYHKDTAYKPLFSLLAAFYPRRIAKALQSQYALLTELRADQHVTHSHNAQDIAATLVKVARLQRNNSSFGSAFAMSYFSNDHLSIRVRHLISPLPTQSLSKWQAIAAIVLLIGFCALSIDSSHHLIETIFAH